MDDSVSLTAIKPQLGSRPRGSGELTWLATMCHHRGGPQGKRREAWGRQHGSCRWKKGAAVRGHRTHRSHEDPETW